MWQPKWVSSFDMVQVLGDGVEMQGDRAVYKPPAGPPKPQRSRYDLRGRWVLKVVPQAWTGARASLMVAELDLAANGTWQSVAGLGEHTVLRGRWGVYADGPDRSLLQKGPPADKIWVLVTRFGLGRSASHSAGVFSEGPFLNQDDDKMYIGAIREVTMRSEDAALLDGAAAAAANATNIVAFEKTLEANGAVMLGLGLEPVSVGNFAMTRIYKPPDHPDDPDQDPDARGYWPSLMGRV